jgi:hypothetical protein
VHEGQEIFVRAHAPLPRKTGWQARRPDKWPSFALVFDTETRLDPRQKLTFGCYRRYELIDRHYVCFEEGLFHADDLPKFERRVLELYAREGIPATKTFPPQLKLKLTTRAKFISHVFWRAARNGDLIVGFNLPFDLSRLAFRFTDGKKGDWSLVLSSRLGKKSGQIEDEPDKPRIVLTSLNSKTAFIKLGSIRKPEEWRNDSRFLDLRTLTWALRNRSFSLDTACDKFGVPGKLEKYKATGQVTPKEIKYCREDVAATARLLNAAKKEFDEHPIELDPDRTYSPASIAKAYLDAMGIARPKERFKVAKKSHGIAMQAYYGGRAECRIRKTPVPVILTDFTSQYPTVNALLGNWEVLRASRVSFETCTGQIRRLFARATLEGAFKPSFWKSLRFFALVKPNDDVVPIRTVYNERSQNIGLNLLSSKKPIWYAGPDLVAAKLLTGKAPKILKAVRLVPSGQQKTLKRTELGGIVPIDPRREDFFVRVVEQRNRYQREKNEGVANFLKVLGNSGSYGLFVQINTETRKKAKKLSVFSGEKLLKLDTTYVEKAGPWYFPPLASLITSGGRLLLAMLEKSVLNERGSYLFCDTDSLCVVGSKNGGLVPCVGGKFSVNGKEAINALSLSQVRAIAKRFNALNPYDPNLVRNLLKIENINFAESDRDKSEPILWGYAIAAKRYALFERKGNEISIRKASSHGLGYLLAPKENKAEDDKEDEDPDEAPEWVMEAWDWLLRKELKLESKEPTWQRLPAMMRMAMTSPNVIKTGRPHWLAPFNFFFFPLLSDLGGYPPGYDRSNFRFITATETNRKKWKHLHGINLWDEKVFRISMYPDGKRDTVVPESFQIILRQYLGHPEFKSLAPDGNECAANTAGLLRRASITAGEIVLIGKETDRRWEHGEDPSLLDYKVTEFRKKSNLLVAEEPDRRRWKKIGVRPLMRKSELTQKTVYAILEGKPVRRQTIAAFTSAVDR